MRPKVPRFAFHWHCPKCGSHSRSGGCRTCNIRNVSAHRHARRCGIDYADVQRWKVRRSAPQNEWMRGRMEALRQMHGGQCTWPTCRARNELEFAHVQPTHLNGEGRGRAERYYDILHYPEAYRLLCRAHHTIYDSTPPN